MIVISRCPYRVSLLGGSSDLDWYVSKNGYGITLGFSIKLYESIERIKITIATKK